MYLYNTSVGIELPTKKGEWFLTVTNLLHTFTHIQITGQCFPTSIMQIKIWNLNPQNTCVIQFWDQNSYLRTGAAVEHKTWPNNDRKWCCDKEGVFAEKITFIWEWIAAIITKLDNLDIHLWQNMSSSWLKKLRFEASCFEKKSSILN